MFRAVGPFRRMLEDRKGILGEAGVRAGMRVADVGAGYGYFALPAAAIVGPQGEVLAVEPDPKRAVELGQKAASEGLPNLQVIQSGAEAIAQISTGTVDLALVMSSFHHMSDRAAALKEIRRILKPGGDVYMRELKAGKIFKHGSRREEFERLVGVEFPGAKFEETRAFLIARAKT